MPVYVASLCWGLAPLYLGLGGIWMPEFPEITPIEALGSVDTETVSVNTQYLPGGSDEESAYKAGDPSSTLGWGRSPGGGKWQPAPLFLLGEPHAQRSLAGYCP